MNELWIHDWHDPKLHRYPLFDCFGISSDFIQNMLPEGFTIHEFVATIPSYEGYFLRIITPESTITLADTDPAKLLGRAVGEAWEKYRLLGTWDKRKLYFDE